MYDINPRRLKLAAIVTVFRRHSNAQHILDRLLDGYGWNGQYHRPHMDLVALYVDQIGADDLSRERESRHPLLNSYPTIAEALTLGGSTLAVDGVVLVGQDGRYPTSKNGQTEYPGYQFFKQIVDVFQSSNRTAPVFNQKHLSSAWVDAKHMYEVSRSMGFPFMAGSSIPVTRRIPSIEMPTGSKVREALCICYGEVDNFHGLEAIQCMVERRSGGEVGVRWLQVYRGNRFWTALDQRVWSHELMQAALCRSHTLTPAREGFNDILPSYDDMRRLVEDPIAYTYQHEDGLQCTVLLMNGLVGDFNFAAQLVEPLQIISTQMYRPMPDSTTTLANCFSPLVFNMERMFISGRAPYPVERTLLTTGLSASGIESLYRNQLRIDTPHLAIRYVSQPGSTFERA